MIPTTQPNAAQKRWMEAVRGLGSIINGMPAVIHHAVGRTAKHNKIEVGHWWLLPLTDEEHRSLHSNDECLLDDLTRKEFEKFWFSRVIMDMENRHPSTELPPPEVLKAIMDYHR